MILSTIISKLKKTNPWIIFFVILILLLSISFLDYITGEEITFSYFYLIPISISIFFSNLKIGILTSILAAFSRLFIYFAWGTEFSSYFVLTVRFLVRLSYYLIHSILLYKFLVLYKQFKELAIVDPLTKISNRHMLEIFLDREIQKSLRTNLPIAIAYFDLDNFKSINDNFGHSTGDKLLKLIGHRITHIIRPNDLFARWGGDEFALVLPETDLNNTKLVVERIQKELTNLFKEKQWEIITLSIGVILFKKFNLTKNEMIKKADELMYKVKKSGKNNIAYFIYQ
ncbi:MAG: GGDEF domain-containing protein [Endomicrobiia bacterium]